MPKKAIYITLSPILLLLIAVYIFSNFIYGHPVGVITKIEEPPVYNPKISIRYKEPYTKLENQLLYARLTTPKNWKDSQGNLYQRGKITINIIRDKKMLVNIVREFDKLMATKPQIVNSNYDDVTHYVLTTWRQGTSVSYVFIKIKSTYYLGSTIHHYKEPGQFVLRKMPNSLLRLIGVKVNKGN